MWCLLFFSSLSPIPGDWVPCGRTCSLRGTGTVGSNTWHDALLCSSRASTDLESVVRGVKLLSSWWEVDGRCWETPQELEKIWSWGVRYSEHFNSTLATSSILEAARFEGGTYHSPSHQSNALPTELSWLDLVPHMCKFLFHFLMLKLLPCLSSLTSILEDCWRFKKYCNHCNVLFICIIVSRKLGKDSAIL